MNAVGVHGSEIVRRSRQASHDWYSAARGQGSWVGRSFSEWRIQVGLARAEKMRCASHNPVDFKVDVGNQEVGLVVLARNKDLPGRSDYPASAE